MAKRCKHCGNWVFDDNGEGYCEHCGRRNHTFRITMSGALAIIATILFFVAIYLESTGVSAWVIWIIVIIAYALSFMHVVRSDEERRDKH